VIKLRPPQKEILTYTSGRMGISAVPGSGKTFTLSLLAAEIIQRGVLADDQEVLVVTLVNSAVDNFYRRVSGWLQQAGMFPQLGYRVRTLHGLAHDIVHERPDLVGLAENFQIVDEREAQTIRDQVALAWLRSHPDALDGFLDPGMEDGKREWVRRDKLVELVREVALNFIRYAKDRQLIHERIRERLEALPLPLSLAEMGCEMYADYQRALLYRGAVDFDDLIRLALEVLSWDERLLERLRYRWPYILEDEAQDSSMLQKNILELLSGPEGNWVRVGDPNQAIYETFTTANPRYLRQFMSAPGVVSHQLPHSGRSTRSIISLANHLVTWVRAEHPTPPVQDALVSPPLIEPAAPDDPDPNPPDSPSSVQIITSRFTPAEEVQYVADSLAKWLPAHQDATVAALVPRNQRGVDLVAELKRRRIDYIELLNSTSSTRQSAGALVALLRYLSDPASPARLVEVYKVWRRDGSNDPALQPFRVRATELLRRCSHVEDYVWPGPEHDWLAELEQSGENPVVCIDLAEFRALLQRWQGSVVLPIDQIMLALSQDLFSEPTDLATSHKLALALHRASQANPSWRLPELSQELDLVAKNERRFLGFSQEDTGFDPELHKGKVVVATIHKAKGLEWQRVYLMSVNNYDFPSGTTYDRYISEKWYLRDKLNLGAEALAQLETAFSSDQNEWYQEGQASQAARLDYVRERLRLLYVGITRAKEELIITWNTGRDGKQQPALPLVALYHFWQDRLYPDARTE